jgi:hypothetical protein
MGARPPPGAARDIGASARGSRCPKRSRPVRRPRATPSPEPAGCPNVDPSQPESRLHCMSLRRRTQFLTKAKGEERSGRDPGQEVDQVPGPRREPGELRPRRSEDFSDKRLGHVAPGRAAERLAGERDGRQITAPVGGAGLAARGADCRGPSPRLRGESRRDQAATGQEVSAPGNAARATPGPGARCRRI